MLYESIALPLSYTGLFIEECLTPLTSTIILSTAFTVKHYPGLFYSIRRRINYNLSNLRISEYCHEAAPNKTEDVKNWRVYSISYKYTFLPLTEKSGAYRHLNIAVTRGGA